MMSIKYAVTFSVLLMSFFTSMFGFSRADGIKVAHRWSDYLQWGDSNSKYSEGYVSLYIAIADKVTGVLILDDFKSQFPNKLRENDREIELYKSDKDYITTKISRYHIWYNKHNLDHYLSDRDQQGAGGIRRSRSAYELKEAVHSAVGAGTFLAADYALERTADKLCGSEAVEKAIHIIPAQSRQFLYENGKFVVASAAGYATRTVLDEGLYGLNASNATKFGKCVAMQVGADFTEQYVVNPIADYLLVEEKSIGKEGLKFALMAGAALALNSIKS